MVDDGDCVDSHNMEEEATGCGSERRAVFLLTPRPVTTDPVVQPLFSPLSLLLSQCRYSSLLLSCSQDFPLWQY
jgi:hypothetical protein